MPEAAVSSPFRGSCPQLRALGCGPLLQVSVDSAVMDTGNYYGRKTESNDGLARYSCIQV